MKGDRKLNVDDKFIRQKNLLWKSLLIHYEVDRREFMFSVFVLS